MVKENVAKVISVYGASLAGEVTKKVVLPKLDTMFPTGFAGQRASYLAEIIFGALPPVLLITMGKKFPGISGKMELPFMIFSASLLNDILLKYIPLGGTAPASIPRQSAGIQAPGYLRSPLNGGGATIV